jgi:Virulence factor BrkB
LTGPIKAEAAEITAFARSSPESAAQWRSLLLIWLLIDALKLRILSDRWLQRRRVSRYCGPFISAVLAAVSGVVGGFLIDAATAYTLDLVVSFAFITLLFAVIYKFAPDVQISWSDVWIGAATASLLFSVGKFLLAFYVGHSTVTSIYGAAGSLVTLLLWVYYSSLKRCG